MLLLVIILLIGALNFVPALILGPITDFLTAR
ncbi:potassium-transporting ATPase subunit KdpA [Leuconostoc sp.]